MDERLYEASTRERERIREAAKARAEDTGLAWWVAARAVHAWPHLPLHIRVIVAALVEGAGMPQLYPPLNSF